MGPREQPPNGWLGSGTTRPLAKTPSTLASNIPLEDRVGIHRQLLPYSRPSLLSARSNPGIRFTFARSDQWTGNLPCGVPFLCRMPYVLSSVFSIALAMNAVNNFISLVCVGLGCSSPTLWSEMWGSWLDAYTARGLWWCVIVIWGTLSNSPLANGETRDRKTWHW